MKLAAILLLLWAPSAMSARAGAQDDPAPMITASVKRAAKARAEGRIDDVKKEVKRAATVAGDRVPLLKFMAAELIDSGFPELAIQVCAQTIARAPDDPGLRGIHGIALLKVHKFVQAIPELEFATQRDPTGKDWWVQLGQAYLQANQEAAALAAIERALKLAPEDIAVLEVKAECEYRNMRLTECETTSRALLAKDPKNAMGWQLLIRVRRTQVRLDAALASADEAIKAIGRHPDIVLERGLVFLAANRNEEAVADLRDAADRLPKDPRPPLHLCKAYTRLGLPKEAAAAKARYLELSPDIPRPSTRKSAR